MLWPCDEHVVRRDGRLPGMRILLDEQAFLAALRCAMPEADAKSARARYVRYKPLSVCLVAYEVALRDGVVSMYAKARPADDPALRREKSGPFTRILPRDCIVIHRFPFDHRLKPLAFLAEVESRRTMLSRILPQHPQLWDCDVHSLSYKPERRFVGQLSRGGTPRAVMRIMLAEDFERANANAKRLPKFCNLLAGRRLGRSKHHNSIATQWLEGRSLETALREARTEDLQRVGAALASLHASDADRLPMRTPSMEADALRQAVEAIDWLAPEQSRMAHELKRSIEHALLEGEHRPRLTHGDLHPHQMLLDEDRVMLIDLDEAAAADPASDLGNLLANLHHQALLESWPAPRVDEIWEAVLSGYGGVGGTCEALVRAFTGAALVRLSAQPFRRRFANWPDLMRSLLRQAIRIMETSTACKERRRKLSRDDDGEGVAVRDPFGVADDAAMPFLRNVIDPEYSERCLRNRIEPGLRLQRIEVRRYKPLRRCLIEYDVRWNGENRALLAKLSAKGPDLRTLRVMEELRSNGFDDSAVDGIAVPEPLGAIPELHAWVQRRAPGESATDLFFKPGGIALARRIAEADYKLQQLGPIPHRRHSMAEELRILHERLAAVVAAQANWADVLDRILRACDRLGAALHVCEPCPIHRDFYADQVLVDGDRLWLLDLDLYCLGDSGLDIGNFIAHMTEYALRKVGDKGALDEVRAATVERFVELCGPGVRASIEVYDTLTLVRHIAISSQFADRRAFTERIIDLCAQRLSI